MSMKTKILFPFLASLVLLNLAACDSPQLATLSDINPNKLLKGANIAQEINNFMGLQTHGHIYIMSLKGNSSPKTYTGQAFFNNATQTQREAMQSIAFGNLSYKEERKGEYRLESPHTEMTQFFGRQHTVTATSLKGEKAITTQFYVPQEIELLNVPANEVVKINSETDYTISWNKDAENSKGVFIKIEPWTIQAKEAKYLWTEDNGTFSIPYADLQANKDTNNALVITVIRGNFKVLTTEQKTTCKIYAISQTKFAAKLVSK
jgi:hypothetical protein